MPPLDARAFAHDWIAAWNAHDLDRILGHYAPHVVLISPVATRLTGDPSGTLTGKDALRSYFHRGLERFPNLEFTLLEVLQGLSSLVLYYKNQRGTHTAEFMEFNADGKVIRVVANYSL
jgi:SnoaL-like domain